MSEMYSGLHVGQRFNSLEEFKSVIRSISVRQHWDLRVMRSNKKSVVLTCRSSPNCYFRAVCRANKHATYITSLQDAHSCRRNAASSGSTPARSEASHVRFLLSEIPKLFDMKNKIKGQEVVEAVKRYHGYDISMRQAQRALTKLQPRRPRVHPDQASDNESSPQEQEQTVQLPQLGQDDPPGFEDLPENRWPQDQLHATLIDGGPMTQGGCHQNQAAPQQVSHVPQEHPSEQRPESRINIPHQTGSPPSRLPVTRPEPKPQRQEQQSGHPATAQLVLTNFKIEFTCTTCGAFNQSFFPNQGNVTSNNYLPQPSVPNQNHSLNQHISTISDGDVSDDAADNFGDGDDDDDEDDDDDDDNEYEENTTNHDRNMQAPWTQGGLEVPMDPRNA